MNRLKEMRERAGLTQKQVAEKIGTQWQVYQRYEYGKTDPSVSTALRIAKALSTTVEVLYEEDKR